MNPKGKKSDENITEGFLSVGEALTSAFEVIKKNESDEKVKKTYVWVQRYKKGTLSNKKISEILEMAGFKKAVEEKWIFIKKPNQVKFSPEPPPQIREQAIGDTFRD